MSGTDEVRTSVVTHELTFAVFVAEYPVIVPPYISSPRKKTTVPGGATTRQRGLIT